MITVPAPPTDNLYKFLALFGLAIVIAAGGMAGKLQLDHEDVERNTEARALASPLEADRLTRSSNPADRARGVALADTVTKLADSVQAVADRLKAKPSKTLPTLICIALAGVAVSTVGFILWYCRFQRYQDRIVERQAAQSSPPSSNTR